MWLIAIAIVLFVSVVPVMIGARVVGARRNGFWVCFAALLVSGLISWFAVRAFHMAGLLSLFASALGYMLILDTTYLRGLAIAIIQTVLTVILVMVLAATAIGGMLHGMHDLMRHMPSLSSPIQSV
jgi:hypothetical protein